MMSCRTADRVHSLGPVWPSLITRAEQTNWEHSSPCEHWDYVETQTRPSEHTDSSIQILKFSLPITNPNVSNKRISPRSLVSIVYRSVPCLLGDVVTHLAMVPICQNKFQGSFQFVLIAELSLQLFSCRVSRPGSGLNVKPSWP